MSPSTEGVSGSAPLAQDSELITRSSKFRRLIGPDGGATVAQPTLVATV